MTRFITFLYFVLVPAGMNKTWIRQNVGSSAYALSYPYFIACFQVIYIYTLGILFFNCLSFVCQNFHCILVALYSYVLLLSIFGNCVALPLILILFFSLRCIFVKPYLITYTILIGQILQSSTVQSTFDYFCYIFILILLLETCFFFQNRRFAILGTLLIWPSRFIFNLHLNLYLENTVLEESAPV